jgi:long-subunit fatty acid transport protein
MMSPVVVEFERAVGNCSWKIGFSPVATRWIVEDSNAWIESYRSLVKNEFENSGPSPEQNLMCVLPE